MTPWPRKLPLLALLAGAGCFTNTITLETDPGTEESTGDALTDSTATPTDSTTATTMDTTTGAPGGSGTYLLAIDSVLAPGLPFQAIVTLTPIAGTETVDLTLQFLSLDIGSTTTPRQLTDAVYGYPGLVADGTGTIYWDTGVILIPGAANPITGADTVVSIQTNVVPVAAGPPAYCGPVGGTVLDPIQAPLDGSTHAMTAVTDAGSLPVDFAVACP